jgi:hypothetical protein
VLGWIHISFPTYLIEPSQTNFYQNNSSSNNRHIHFIRTELTVLISKIQAVIKGVAWLKNLSPVVQYSRKNVVLNHLWSSTPGPSVELESSQFPRHESIHCDASLYRVKLDFIVTRADSICNTFLII